MGRVDQTTSLLQPAVRTELHAVREVLKAIPFTFFQWTPYNHSSLLRQDLTRQVQGKDSEDLPFTVTIATINQIF